MNAHTLTASGIALRGKKRAAQSVHVVKTCHGEGRVRRVVLVVSEGQEAGTYYEVYSPLTLQALLDGMTPEELELEPHPSIDQDEDDFDRQFAETRHNNELRRAGLYRA